MTTITHRLTGIGGKRLKFLNTACGKPGCPPSEKDKLAGYETTKALTTSGLVVGGVLLGAGALMIGLAPSSPSPGRAASSPAVVPLIGAGSAGVKVVF